MAAAAADALPIARISALLQLHGRGGRIALLNYIIDRHGRLYGPNGPPPSPCADLRCCESCANTDHIVDRTTWTSPCDEIDTPICERCTVAARQAGNDHDCEPPRAPPRADALPPPPAVLTVLYGFVDDAIAADKKRTLRFIAQNFVNDYSCYCDGCEAIIFDVYGEDLWPCACGHSAWCGDCADRLSGTVNCLGCDTYHFCALCATATCPMCERELSVAT